MKQKLFTTTHTFENAELKIQKKTRCYPIQLRVQLILYNLQNDVKNELERLLKPKHLERLEVTEICFVPPFLLLLKKTNQQNMFQTPVINTRAA